MKLYAILDIRNNELKKPSCKQNVPFYKTIVGAKRARREYSNIENYKVVELFVDLTKIKEINE